MTLRVPYGPRITQDARAGHSQITYEQSRIIVPRGTMLDDNDDDHRAACAYESLRRPPSAARIISSFVIYFIVCQMLMAYLRRFGQSRVRLLRRSSACLLMILASVVCAKALLVFTPLPEFWMPNGRAAAVGRAGFDRRTAFIVDLCVAFIASSLLRFDVVLFSVLLTRGIAATLFFFKRRQPRQMLVAGTFSGLTGAVAYICLTTVFEGRFQIEDLTQGGAQTFSPASAAASRRLPRPRPARAGGAGHGPRLARQAPRPHRPRAAPAQEDGRRGAGELGARPRHGQPRRGLGRGDPRDALLTRVGAYYHDLGKTVQPKYFVENLQPGESSPHQDLEPDVSADAIMTHVVLGAKILRNGGIPEPVVEFCYTHHGTQVVEFFWHKCNEQGNPKGLTQEHFRYPGMKPQTKETAILMLVDSIEAASRTIWPPEQKKFEEMVQRVMFTKLQSGQLDDSGLTIEDLRTMTGRMASTLVNMYHGRIKYPWQREAEQRAAAAAPAAAAAEPAAAAAAEPAAAAPAAAEPAASTPAPATVAPSSAPSVAVVEADDEPGAVESARSERAPPAPSSSRASEPAPESGER